MSRILTGILFLSVSFVLLSCGSKPLETYHDKGVKMTLELLEELQNIQSRDELVAASPRLKKLFLSLVEISIAAQEYQEKHPHAELLELMPSDHERSALLRIELQRIYHIEGCRELMEKCQAEALNTLDGYQQLLQRRKRA